MNYNIYCTLFNVNYLDKGLVLYESLERVCRDFILYVLAMDDKCYEVLCGLSKPHLRPIRLSEFENDQLRVAKGNRSFGEYCWTCSASLIKYVLEDLNQPACTYLDADMCFYEDPSVLIEEMLSKGAEVLLVGHRFNSFEREERERISGKYCVQFNTFLNSERAKKLLNTWVVQSISLCSSTVGEGSLGDQMYLNDWVNDNDFVLETENLGAGVAPWNVKQYKLSSNNNGHYLLRCNGTNCSLVFYHFENLTYIDKHTININVFASWGIDGKFVRMLYKDYLLRLDSVKDMLQEKYRITILIKRHPAQDWEAPGIWQRLRTIVTKLLNYNELKHYFLSSIPKQVYSKKNIVIIGG